MASIVEQAIKATRKKRIPVPSTSLELPRRYEKKLEKILLQVVEAIRSDFIDRVIPAIKSLQLEYNQSLPNKDSIRFDDDIATRLLELMSITRATVSDKIPTNELEKEINAAGLDVSSWNRQKINQAFKVALGIDLFQSEPWLKNELSIYLGETLNLIKDVEEQYITQSSRTILSGFRNSTRHEVIAKKITANKKFVDKNGKVSRFVVAKNRAKLIARDQTNKLNGKLTELRQKNAGVKKYVWRTVGDDRVRDSHAAHNGKTYSWDNPPSDTGHPGEDINCFIGSIKVNNIGKLKRVYKRMYIGEGIRIHSGLNAPEIVCTPNHPILTCRGFISAYLVNKTDKVFRCFSLKDIFNIRRPNKNNIESVFETINNLSPVITSKQRIRGAKPNFHGDGIVNENINVISIKSRLINTSMPILGKKINNLFFSFADMGNSFLSCLGSLFNFRYITGFSFSANMGSTNLISSFSFRHLTPFKFFVFRLGSKFNSHFLKHSPNRSPCSLIILRKTINRFTIKIPLSKFIFRKTFYFIPRYALFVTTHKINSIEKIKINENVYNLETNSGFYIAQGVMVSNCRCYASPVFEV